MAYTLGYQGELRKQKDYFRDIKDAEINEDSLELAEALIARTPTKFDLRKFEDGYEVAVKELINAKINHLPGPKDQAPWATSGRVVNLINALRKSLGSNRIAVKVPKKPVVSEKIPARKGIGLVKAPTNGTGKRKSAQLPSTIAREWASRLQA